MCPFPICPLFPPVNMEKWKLKYYGNREKLAKNIDIWQRLRHIFSLAIPHLQKHSLFASEPDSSSLILAHYAILKEDLHYLNNLLVISRNMLAIKETAQEICTRVGFDKEVRTLIALCVSVTSKGYDGESVGEGERNRLLEITELCPSLYPTLNFYLERNANSKQIRNY